MMPSLSDWKYSPLEAIKRIFDNFSGEKSSNGNEWEKEVTNFFDSKLSDHEAWLSIDSLNITENHNLVDGQLVRFRCMVQDMFDPEFYPLVYEVNDLSTCTKVKRTAKYSDVALHSSREELLLETDAAVTKDRMTYYCISVPGETPWVLDAYNKNSPVPTIEEEVKSSCIKRPFDEDEDEKMDLTDCSEKKQKTDDVQCGATASGPLRGNLTGSSNKSTLPIQFNFPLPFQKGNAAILKVYDEYNLKLNDVVEVVGVCSVNPVLSGHDEMAVEIDACSPPPSLVPRIHVISCDRLEHTNPLLENRLPAKISLEEDLKDCLDTRNEVIKILTDALLGDSLAAEYLLCNLLSQVYIRKEILCIGKFALNIIGVPLHSKYTVRLYEVIMNLVNKSHYFPMTLDNMNKSKFLPSKDYEANRLISGLLQLSSNTHLVLDETKLTTGQLNESGMKNMTALGNLLTWQKVSYDFKYHQMDFDSDVPALVLSDGRSLLPADVQVVHRPTSVANVEEVFCAIEAGTSKESVAKVRKYLTICRKLEYELDPEMQKLVQEDFVSERSGGNNSKAMTTEDLHTHLVIARLVSMSHGHHTLTPDLWNKTKHLEVERKKRMLLLPQRNEQS